MAMEVKVINGLKRLIEGSGFVKKVKEHIDLHSFVNQTVDFFGEDKFNGDRNQEVLSSIFSVENKRKLVAVLKNSNGYDLKANLEKVLDNLLNDSGLCDGLSTTIKRGFHEIVEEYIKENHPEIYDQYYNKQSVEQILDEQRRTNKKIDDSLVEILKKLDEANDIKAFTIDDLDRKLKESTENPSIGVSFFSLDKDELMEQLDNELLHSRVSVCANNREEALYEILWYLRDRGYEQKTLVINGNDSWEKIVKKAQIDKGFSDFIFIPYFIAESIPAIDNNTVIYLYERQEEILLDKCIDMGKRRFATVIKSLEQAGLNSGEAYDLAENTKAIYPLIKNHILKGSIYKHYGNTLEAGVSDETLITALLCNSWEDNEYDQVVIEDLSGMKYQTFIDDLEKVINTNVPFVVKRYRRGRWIYQISDVEFAWAAVRNKVTGGIWHRFTELVHAVFDIGDNTHVNDELSASLANIDYWSETLMEGLLSSLVMYAIQQPDDRSKQAEVDGVVDRVLNNINDLGDWLRINKYVEYMCEAAPRVYSEKISKDISKDMDSGLLKVFGIGKSDRKVLGNAYTHYLWAAEILLQLQEYKESAFEWLLKVNEYNSSYVFTNSPSNILRAVLAPWINVSAFSQKEKLKIARKALDRYDNSWGLVAGNLFNKVLGGMVSPLARTHHRDLCEKNDLTDEDIWKLYCDYLELCVEYAGTDGKRWKDIIPRLSDYTGEEAKKSLQILSETLGEFNDENKEILKESLRLELYRNRYFPEALWSMGESELRPYEDVLSKIHMNSNAYESLYYFLPHHDIHPICPVPAYADEHAYETNQEYVDQEIKAAVKKLSIDDIKELATLCLSIKENTLGEHLGLYYNDGKYSEIVSNILLNSSDDGDGRMLYDYLRVLVRKEELGVKQAYNIVEKKNNVNLSANIIRLQVIQDRETALIIDVSEKVQRHYWEQRIPDVSCSADLSTLKWVFSELVKYASNDMCIEYVFRYRSKFNVSGISRMLVETTKFSRGIGRDIDYYLQEIYKGILNDNISGKDVENFAKVEFFYFQCLNWHTVHFIEEDMKCNPQIQAGLVKEIYKKESQRGESAAVSLEDGIDSVDLSDLSDEEKKYREAKRRRISLLYDFYSKAKYCPGEKDEIVNYDILREWIEGFKKLLQEQEQGYLFGRQVGRLLAYGPMGEDKIPCDEVCRIIDDIYDEELARSYLIEEENKRGLYTLTAGQGEKVLAERYKNVANILKEKGYDKIANIYEHLYEFYMSQSKYERSIAENE